MLSGNLASLCERLRHYKDGGVGLTPAGVVAVCAILEAAIEDARALETCVVPERARCGVDDLPGNVVRLADILLERGDGLKPRAVGPGPGDAA